MDRTPSTGTPLQPAATKFGEHQTDTAPSAPGEPNYKEIICRAGIDPEAYEEMRWLLARRVGCSVEAMDEVLARCILQFNLHGCAP